MTWMNSKNIMLREKYSRINKAILYRQKRERLVAWDQGGRLIMCGQKGTFRLMKRPILDCGSGDRDI